MSVLALRTAIVGLVDGDTVIRGLTGRTQRSMIAWGEEVDSEQTSYPIGTLRIVSAPRMSGTNGRRRIRGEVEWWSDAGDAYTELEALMSRTFVLLTGANLKTKNVEAAVIPADDVRDGSASGGIRSIQADFIFELTL